MKTSFWNKIAEQQSKQKDFVVMTLLNVRGSAPQEIGAKALVTAEGLQGGTIGGGKLEATAIEKAMGLLQSQSRVSPEVVTWNLQKDIKMTCGGEVQVLFEHFTQAHWKIAIFGAGHVAQALTTVLSSLECSVKVIDPRKEWLEQISGENITTLCCEQPEHYAQNLGPEHFVLSITKGHSFDVPVLAALAQNEAQNSIKFPFIGAIGSETKARAIKSELSGKGISSEFLERLHIPLGLALGNNDPAEIAISISAQLLQERDRLNQ